MNSLTLKLKTALILSLIMISSAFAQEEEPVEIVIEMQVSQNELKKMAKQEYQAGSIRYDSDVFRNTSQHATLITKYYDGKDLLADAALVGIIMGLKDHLEQDKFQHFVAGALITYGSIQVAKLIFKNKDRHKVKVILGGLTLALLAGLSKEMYDGPRAGDKDLKDHLYTVLGGTLVAFRFNLKY